MKILAIDDSPNDLIMLKAAVGGALPGTEILTALSGPEGVALARAEDPDVVLLDILMPGMDGFSVCRELKEDDRLQSIPVVFLTGLITDRDSRIQALDAGAEGFLPKPLDEVELLAQLRVMARIKAANRLQRLEKDQLAALVAERTRKLEEELASRSQAEKALRDSEFFFKESQRVAFIGSYKTDFVAGFWESSEVLDQIFGIDKNYVRSVPGWLDITHPDDREMMDRYLKEEVIAKRRPFNKEYRILRKSDGEVRWVNGLGETSFDADGKIVAMIGTIQDITERVQAGEALASSEKEFHLLAEAMPQIVWATRADGWNIYFNRQWFEYTGLTPEESHGHGWNIPFHPDDQQRAWDAWQNAVTNNATYSLECRLRRRDGVYRWWLIRGVPVLDEKGGILKWFGTCTDIQDIKHSQEEREKLQEKLTQAQKMESVGRLAGGVAHDFNSMLTVIQGNAAMVIEDLPPDSPHRENLAEIEKCARRSADLTRQLLAFARKQIASPKILDLNETLESMLKMLRGIIGGDIDLEWHPATGLWPIKADPGQVGQVLANLCLNARDAIGGVGKITLKTENVTIDQAYCQTHTDIVPGDYVTLAFSDDGCGMDKEVLTHLFEPFFTTKDVGKGTGLGLATVYGIVKQNHAFINVESKPGCGTTFKLHVPRHAEEAPPIHREGPAVPTVRGLETILLVEDEPSILIIGRRVLESLGYTVLTAGTPGEAVRLASGHAGEIHLLITDVIMPEMNGQDLAKCLLSLHPGLKRLFMSGYTADIIAHNGILEEGIHFLQKPFTREVLADKVRQALMH